MLNRGTYLSLNDATRPVVPVELPRYRLRTVAASVVILAVGVPISLLGRRVWQEWTTLMVEERAATASVVVGYPNIYPVVSRADRPRPWRRIEGDAVLVWSGWKNGEGHSWFKLVNGDCDLAAIGDPIGRDIARSIDFPAVEIGGGRIWERIPDDADVVAIAVGKTACIYPRAVLSKVLIINDEVEGTPILLHDDPFTAQEQGDVAAFDPRLDGRRITMGSSGFTVDGHHVLYDRGTESLWIDRGEGLRAFSGKHKGRTLPLVKRLAPTPWGDWEAGHPSARLLVGSLDRHRAVPSE